MYFITIALSPVSREANKEYLKWICFLLYDTTGPEKHTQHRKHTEHVTINNPRKSPNQFHGKFHTEPILKENNYIYTPAVHIFLLLYV